MENGVNTRYNLHKLRVRREMFGSGAELLKRRREALTRDFLGLVDECMDFRDELEEAVSVAQRKLQWSEAVGADELWSFSYASKRKINVDARVVNVWGVNVPEIEEKPIVRSLTALDLSEIGERAGLVDTAREFEGVIEKVVKMASSEIRLERLGDMIKADTRKINAIEELVLPKVAASMRRIERTLEEREREEIFRLKRFKSRKSVQSI